jgi:hypothetical protein
MSPTVVHAELGLRKHEKQDLQQGAFDFADAPEPVLRAVHVTTSESAQEQGFSIFRNMRVPQKSVIWRIFDDRFGYAEAIEDLAWWESSDGTRLPSCTVLVKARFSWDGVEALIMPAA